jgi:hypothetical protein
MRTIENDLPLASGILDNSTMRQNRMIVLTTGNDEKPWQFGIKTHSRINFSYIDNCHIFYILILMNTDDYLEESSTLSFKGCTVTLILLMRRSSICITSKV